MRAMMLLLGLAICSLCAFLYVMGHPSPRGPGFLRRFRLHPSAIPDYLALLARGLFHPRLLRSDAPGHEKGRSLPGDQLVPKPHVQETRAITIDVPPATVWPWIVHLGGGRPGWYRWTPLHSPTHSTRKRPPAPGKSSRNSRTCIGDALSDGEPNVTDERGNWIVKAIDRNQLLVLYAARQVMEGPDFDREKHKPKGLWFVSGWRLCSNPSARARRG